MKKFGKRAISSGVALAVCTALYLPASGLAQDASDDFLLEEIVVTATRRAESLREIPVSVAAYTQDKMDVQGLKDVADIASFTPSVTFSQSDGLRPLNSNFTIRGVTQQSASVTTGVYVNDTPVAIRQLRVNGDPMGTAFPRLFDVERVEVLRGPQGTLFGSGSEGGTLRFILPEPNLHETSTYARAGVSTTKYGSPSWEAGLAGGTPIIEDKLGFRASIFTSQTGGYVDHGDYYTGKVDQKDFNSQKTFALQASMKWKVTDDFSITPLYYHQQINANGMGTFYLPDDTNGVDTTDPAYIDYYNGFDGKYRGYYGHFGQGVGSGNYVNATRTIPTSR